MKSNNRTILFITHNWKEVEDVATKIAFINKGTIVMQPTSVVNIMQSLPHSKKIITDYNEIIVDNIKEFDYYINENLLHIFVNNESNIIEIIIKYYQHQKQDMQKNISNF